MHALVLDQYDRMIGLDLDDVAVDGCLTKAPGGGEVAGRSPVDRGKQGLKRSVLTDGNAIPLHVVVAGAHRHDAPLLAPTLAGLERWDRPMLGTTVHLDAGYDSRGTRALLADRQLAGRIARRGAPAPVQAGRRWGIERTHAWMSTFGRLRRCPDRHETIVTFYVYLAAAIVTTQCLIPAARTRYRWSTRPTTHRLKYCLMPGALSSPPRGFSCYDVGLIVTRMSE